MKCDMTAERAARDGSGVLVGAGSRMESAVDVVGVINRGAVGCAQRGSVPVHLSFVRVPFVFTCLSLSMYTLCLSTISACAALMQS